MNGAWKDLSKPAKRMYILFGLLTLWTMAGPGLVALSLNFGNDHHWPPENSVEWFGVILGIGGFIFLMFGTLISVVLYKSSIAGAKGLEPDSAGTIPPDRV